MTPELVKRLCKEAAEQPEKMLARSLRKQQEEEKKNVIAEVTTNFLQTGQPIVQAHQIKLAVEEKSSHEVSIELVRRVFRKELRISYRLAKAQPAQTNLERALVL